MALGCPRVCGLGPGVSTMAPSALCEYSPPRGLTPLWIRWDEMRKTVTVLVNANDTVLDVKSKIHKTKGILPEQQCLISPPTKALSANGSVMDDAHTIGSYLPQLESFSSNDNTVELVTTCTIFVTRISGAQLQLNVRLGDTTTLQVKKTIEKRTKIPVALQYLMFAGDVLEDCEWLTLAFLGIKHGSTLDLVVSSTNLVVSD